MDSDLQGYLIEKGWQYKLVESGSQVQVIDECPFCGKPKHLMFNAATTTWDCKRCGETGNLLTMKRRLGDIKVEVRSASDFILHRGQRDKKVLPGSRPPDGLDLHYHDRLFSGDNEDTLDYLIKGRGFTEESLHRFKIGIAENNGRRLIAIPHHYNGELVCFKFRTIPPEKKIFTRWKDCPSILFNGDALRGLEALPPNRRKVAVCEGEFDAMALVQMGYERVVSTTTGAGRSDWPAHWLELLEPATVIYLCYDADDAGEEGADKAAATLGRYRCRRVVPPMHDWAECLSANADHEMVAQSIALSREYDEQVVKPTSAFCDDLRAHLSKGQPKGRSTGWVSLDSILGGIRDGEFTVITGDTGSGKTTFTTALCRYQAMQDVPCLIAPFEQRPYDVIGKLVSMDASKSIYDMDTVELDSGLTKIVDQPYYFLDIHGTSPLGVVKDSIYIAARRYGVKFVVLDHLHFFLDCKQEEERFAIDAAVRSMALWVQDLDIHIALVVHPKGLGKDNRGAVRKVTTDDLKGSSEIKKTAWNIIRVHRNRTEAMGTRSDSTEVAVLKCRSSAGSEGACLLQFDPNGENYLEGTYSMGHGPMRGDAYDEEWSAWNEPQ